MSRIAALATAAFTQLWRALGSPTLTVIAPLADWDLPPGVTYQPETDLLTDATGKRVTDLAALWTAQRIPALPARAVERIYDAAIGGVVETGRAGYLVPWVHKGAFVDAWGAQDAQGQLWRIGAVRVDLTGAPVTVELERR